MVKRSLEVSIVFSLVATAAAARAQAPVTGSPVSPIPTPPPPALVPTPREPAPERIPRPPAGNARLALGYRQAVIPNRGFDTYATDDRLSQVSLETSYALLNGRQGAFAAGIAWDFGTRAAVTNGMSAAMNVHRLTVPLEGRLYLARWVYAFGRVAPGATMYQARVTNVGTTLTGNPWVPAVDSSAGVSLLLGPHGEQADDVARVWLTPEVGYGWSGPATINLTSERGPVVLASVPERLPELAVRGPYFRATIGFTL